MNNLARIQTVLILTKKDAHDFPREDVTTRLSIQPTDTAPPILSKGKLSYTGNITDIERDLSGITILKDDPPPYRYIRHAYWCLKLPPIDCNDIALPLHQLEKLLEGKEKDFQTICQEYDLFSDLFLRLHLKSNIKPIMTIPCESVRYWGLSDTSISLTFV